MSVAGNAAARISSFSTRISTRPGPWPIGDVDGRLGLAEHDARPAGDGGQAAGELQRAAGAPRREQQRPARRPAPARAAWRRPRARSRACRAGRGRRRGPPRSSDGSMRGRPVPLTTPPTSSTPPRSAYAARLPLRADVHATSKPSSARCPAVAAATPSCPTTQTRVRPAPERSPPAGPRGAAAALAPPSPRPRSSPAWPPAGARGGAAAGACAPPPWAEASAAAKASKSPATIVRSSGSGGGRG